MADPDRKTAPVVGLTPTVDGQPNPGRRVLGLQHGGCLVPLVWTSTSHLDIDAWMDYPKTPDKVKKIQAARMAG
jgi:hypothetical protein